MVNATSPASTPPLSYPNVVSGMLHATDSMSVNTIHHQNSESEARPVNTAYLLKQVLID